MEYTSRYDFPCYLQVVDPFTQSNGEWFQINDTDIAGIDIKGINFFNTSVYNSILTILTH